MSLLDRAKADLQQITSNSNEFGVSVVFTASDSTTATVNCLHTIHHTGFDTDGIRVNSKQASIAVKEDLLTDADYPVRNSNNEVTFKNHRALLNGTEFIIREWYPDDTLGLIVLILGVYE